MNPTATITQEEAAAVRAAANAHADRLAAEISPRYFAMAYYGSEDGAGEQTAAVFYRSPEELEAIKAAGYDKAKNVRIIGARYGKDSKLFMSISDTEGRETTDFWDVMDGTSVSYVAEHCHGWTEEADNLANAFLVADGLNAEIITEAVKSEAKPEDEAKRQRFEAAKASFEAAALLVSCGQEDKAADVRATVVEIILAEFNEVDVSALDPAAIATVNDIWGDRVLDYIGEIETDAGKAVELLERFPGLFGRKSEIQARIEYETREKHNEARAFDRIIDEEREKEREIALKIANAEECREECMNAADTLARLEKSI